MGQIAIPSSTASSASNTVKYLKVGTSGGTIYMGEVRVFPSDEDVSSMPSKALTLVAWENTTFTFTPTSGQVLSYSTDDGTTWSTLPSTGIAVSAGQEVRFSGACVPVESSSTVTAEVNWGIGKFSSTGKYHAEGNVMSLLGSGWASKTDVEKNYAFVGLFSGSTTLMTSQYLSLAPTTLKGACYRSMFRGCSNMTKGPELPATTLSNVCYLNMFHSCSKLLVAPKLPATTVPGYAYYGMFSGCTSLTVAPELPATTLNDTNCYNRMFGGCTKLTVAPKLPALSVPNSGYGYMFSACTSLTIGPELPATSVGSQAYRSMFNGCTKLETITSELPSLTMAAGAYHYMFCKCSKITSSPIIRATNISTSGCDAMFSACTQLSKITCLSTNITATSATTGWTNGVAASGTFIKDASMTGWTTGIDGIPTGWTVKNCYGDKKYPLTFIAREACTFTFSAATNTTNALQYSVNNGSTWASLPSTGVSVASGGAIMFRGSCVSNGSSGSTSAVPIGGIGKFGSTGAFDIEGNIMSLLYNDNFSGQTSLVGVDVFASLFASTPVVNAENLILPATTLTSYCYIRMFNSCTSLITTPKLLAENLTNGCYYYMFQGCSSLVDAPELPSMSLSGYCYQGMFNNCRSLVNAPKLPATTLATRCYRYMFQNCTSLTTAPELTSETVSISGYSCMFLNCTNLKYIKCLATNISATDCTSGWTSGVATGGTFVKDPEMTGWTRSTTGIPTTWKDSDYLTFVALERTRFRFNYPVSKEATNKLSYSLDGGETWVDNLYSTLYTPFIEKGEKIMWKGNCTIDANYGIGTFESTGNFDAEGNVMSLLYGDDYATQVSLASKTYVFAYLFSRSKIVNANNLLLPATTLASYCYRNMFEYCTNLTTAPILPATTLSTQCYYSMFSLCTSLTKAPVLPATTLVSGCYYGMFTSCSSLNYIKAMFTTTPSNSYTRYWVTGVASTGTFVKNSAATWNVTGTNGVPTGWTVQTETP